MVLSSSEGEPGHLRVGLRHHDPKRRHGEDLPRLRRQWEPAEALGRHVVQPAAAGRSVAQPAVGRAGQLHPGPEEEDPPAQQTALLMRTQSDDKNVSNRQNQTEENSYFNYSVDYFVFYFKD